MAIILLIDPDGHGLACVLAPDGHLRPARLDLGEQPTVFAGEVEAAQAVARSVYAEWRAMPSHEREARPKFLSEREGEYVVFPVH